MMYKKKTCKGCVHADEAPRPPGIANLQAPKLYNCRGRPPTPVYAIGQDKNGQPRPMILGSVYAPVDDNYPACRLYETLGNFDTEEELSLPGSGF